MAKRLLDPITFHKRGKNLQRIQEKVNRDESQHRGSTLNDWQRMTKVLNWYHERYATRYPNQKSRKEILLGQALIATKEMSHTIDHVISREKQVGIIEKGDLKQEHRMWGAHYATWVARIKNDRRIVNNREILEEIEKLRNYIWAPKSIVEGRLKEWAPYERHIGKGRITERTIGRTIRILLASRMSPENKARTIIRAVSLCADSMERRRTNPANWTLAYKDTMLSTYDLIAKQPKVLAEIIDME